MSVYAHRIIRIITVKKYVSFDLWKNRTLVNFLDADGNFYHQFYSDGTGITEASVEMLEKAIDQARLLDLDTATVDNIKKDIKWAKKHGHEFIQYSCF